MDEDTIRLIVQRLARPHPSGGKVIERAAILAEGTRSAAILEWITTHAWEPEEVAPASESRGGTGLHGARPQGRGSGRVPTTRRYVLPPGAGG